MTFGEMLRAAREKEGLSLRKAAKLLGVSHTYWYEVENGGRPPFRLSHRERLAQVLPSLPREALETAAAACRPVKIRMMGTSPTCRRLVGEIAARIESGRIDDVTADAMLELLAAAGEGSE